MTYSMASLAVSTKVTVSAWSSVLSGRATVESSVILYWSRFGLYIGTLAFLHIWVVRPLQVVSVTHIGGFRVSPGNYEDARSHDPEVCTCNLWRDYYVNDACSARDVQHQ